jgi:importin subunit beta-1
MIAAQLLQPYVESIFQLLAIIYQDPNRSEALLRSSMGIIGYVQLHSSERSLLMSGSDLAQCFPNGEFSTYYRADWIMHMIKDTRSNVEFQPSTIETARWARELVKRQIGGAQGVHQA